MLVHAFHNIIIILYIMYNIHLKQIKQPKTQSISGTQYQYYDSTRQNVMYIHNNKRQNALFTAGKMPPSLCVFVMENNH